MAEEKTRVDFNAPASLVDRADRVAEVLDVSRTRLLIDALEDELASLADDEEFRRRLADAYYGGRVDFETVESVLGREEAMRMKLLRASLERSPPELHPPETVPTDEEFYDGEPPELTPAENSSDDDSDPAA
jgi:predicted transcriptional regulator